MRLIRNLYLVRAKCFSTNIHDKLNHDYSHTLRFSLSICNAAVIDPTFRVVVSSRLTLYIYASPLGQSNPETARVVT